MGSNTNRPTTRAAQNRTCSRCGGRYTFIKRKTSKVLNPDCCRDCRSFVEQYPAVRASFGRAA